MKCPCCGTELTVGQELLYKLEDVYYCPYCSVRITGWPSKKKEAEQRGRRVGPDKSELGEGDGLPETAAQPVLDKSVR